MNETAQPLHAHTDANRPCTPHWRQGWLGGGRGEGAAALNPQNTQVLQPKSELGGEGVCLRENVEGDGGSGGARGLTPAQRALPLLLLQPCGRPALQCCWVPCSDALLLQIVSQVLHNDVAVACRAARAGRAAQHPQHNITSSACPKWQRRKQQASSAAQAILGLPALNGSTAAATSHRHQQHQRCSSRGQRRRRRTVGHSLSVDAHHHCGGGLLKRAPACSRAQRYRFGSCDGRGKCWALPGWPAFLTAPEPLLRCRTTHHAPGPSLPLPGPFLPRITSPASPATIMYFSPPMRMPFCGGSRARQGEQSSGGRAAQPTGGGGGGGQRRQCPRAAALALQAPEPALRGHQSPPRAPLSPPA